MPKEREAQVTDEELKAVLDHFHLSWAGYRKVRKGVKKRLVRTMARWGCAGVQDWLDLCRADPEARRQCLLALAVHISRFFRDRRLWYSLQTAIVPGLCRWCGPVMRVWSAGCSRGEEIYSFKILWHELAKAGRRLPRLEAWATDVDPEVLGMARRAVFQRSSLKEVGRELLDVYFEPIREGGYRVRESVREGIHWSCSDLLQDSPPASEFHLIFLRNNLLTYYSGGQVDEAFSRIWDSLAVGGFLVTGSREKMPPGPWKAVQSFQDPHLFRKWGQ
jgi:chemotaxis methyl-accepting protein methylase